MGLRSGGGSTVDNFLPEARQSTRTLKAGSMDVQTRCGCRAQIRQQLSDTSHTQGHKDKKCEQVSLLVCACNISVFIWGSVRVCVCVRACMRACM